MRPDAIESVESVCVDGEVFLARHQGPGGGDQVELHHLRSTAAEVWGMLERTCCDTDLVACLTARYPHAKGLEPEVRAFLRVLREARLLAAAADQHVPAVLGEGIMWTLDHDLIVVRRVGQEAEVLSPLASCVWEAAHLGGFNLDSLRHDLDPDHEDSQPWMESALSGTMEALIERGYLRRPHCLTR
jgi:hypothetical protein